MSRQRAAAIPRVDLHQLAHDASLEALEGALQRRADPRTVNMKGETLFHALARGNTWQREENFTPQGTVYREIELPSRIYGGIIVVLLLHGVRINQRDKKGKTPLHTASGQGTPSFIRLLIQRGARTKKKDKYGRTIVHYAMKNRKESIQTVLANVSRVPILLAEPDKYGMTPLGYACMHGNEEALQTILPLFKGSLEHRDKRDRSYLQLAAAGPNPAACVALLLAKGANPCSCDANGRTPLHTAVLRKKADAALVTALTANSSAATLTELLDKQDNLGNTALHYAVKNGLADAARVLLSKGASILPDNQGITPFHIAISRKDIEACRTLLHHFNDTAPEAVSLLVRPDLRGRTLLHWLSVYGDSELDDLWEEETLFQANPAILATPHLIDSNGLSPLHLAAEKDYVHAIKKMVPLLESVHEVRDKRMRSPLHIAAKYGKYDATKVLLKQGLPVDALDSRGRTPLIIACQRGEYEVVIEMSRFGPDPSIRDNTGKCAMDYAAAGGHANVMAYLSSRHIFDFADCREEVLKHHDEESAKPIIAELDEMYKEFTEGNFSDDDSSDDDSATDSDSEDGDDGRSGSVSSSGDQSGGTPRTTSSISNATRLAQADALSEGDPAAAPPSAAPVATPSETTA